MLKNVKSFVRRKVLPDSGSELPVSFAAKTVTTVCVDCSQSPVFREIARGSSAYWYGGHLGLICTEGAGVSPPFYVDLTLIPDQVICDVITGAWGKKF